MGYLSCKAESSISIADSHASTSFSPSNKFRYQSEKEKPKEKPIKIQEFNYKDLELATSNFSQTKLLGRGSHGLVYKGVLRGGRLVAVKKSSRPAQRMSISENPNEFENEIDILSKLQSPRLVNLVGFSKNDSQDRLLVVEFMSNGTLYDVLHSNSRPPNWGRRIKLALQTAKGIDVLHSLNPPVIHRDIKSANVLIDRNFNARLGDFGLALRCVDDCRLRSTPPAGTMGYLDPGYVTPDNLSTKTDVFSFGILLLEIISGRKAIDVAHSPPSIVDWAIPLIRRGKLLSIYDPRIMPPKDASVRKALGVVAAKCVRSCRERRPSMKEVVECLSELSKLVPLHSWNGIANPCLMVDTVGKPVQSRNAQVISKGDDMDARVGTPLSTPRRVYSDLGVRSNLMELMSGPHGESRFLGEDDGEPSMFGPKKRVSSFRFESSKFVGRSSSSIRSMVLGKPSIMADQ
ncbi:Protein kinase superfamily protein [Perilla frutescens var. hirtella]|uniref:Protein kinase superfamily protein n=1 Tax=Perilla frutescens var. hirtella TaxID=608512 RepID=A0AAD4JPV5_PERFH|nr:Protein kinase superfamily protein [Perilla frutescens var. hirtella]KAH6810682.1 Protein kinase superfamily protein [Perilla frutescens var. frutescens]KAH6836940.1 Protein kinase superfamily protein [Perilla frutescens var. hirtella]